VSDGDPRADAGIPPEHLAALSHELRTPLGGVLGMADLLEATRLTAEQRSYVAALKESGAHLLGLVNDVLDYARLGGAHVALEPTTVDIEELLRSVCELMSPRAHEKGLEIAWAAQAGLTSIIADEGRLRQILLNFAGNAVKFAAKGGVLLRAEAQDGGNVRLTVFDTGPGVPADARERIFEPFQRLDRTTDAEGGGAGLGLAIVRRIAESMGGRVGIDGREGEGATFWVEIQPSVHPGRPGPRALKGRAVVIASPSPIVREAAALQVEASGGRATRVESLKEAMDLTDDNGVILADHAEAAPSLLRGARNRRIVVMLRPEERGVIGDYRRRGFAGYLIKPLRRASLVLRLLAAEAGAPGVQLPEDERIDPERNNRASGQACGARILLAEDNPINAMLARTLLQREGCEVDHVVDGVAVIAAASKRPYDLVLMDVRMPGVDGMEATRRLRAAGISTPVVALTADAFDDDRQACLSAGMDDFLVKPLSADALRATLVRWTGSLPPPTAETETLPAEAS
jgi:CheY-like chemotaxis protein